MNTTTSTARTTDTDTTEAKRLIARLAMDCAALPDVFRVLVELAHVAATARTAHRVAIAARATAASISEHRAGSLINRTVRSLRDLADELGE